MATRKTKSEKPTPTPKPQPAAAETASYEHKTAVALIRPEVGVQPRFKKRKPAARYAYDASLAPELAWDGQNPAREPGEALIAQVARLQRGLAELDAAAQTDTSGDAQQRLQREAQRRERRAALLLELRGCTEQLQALSRPFLHWAGKAERLSFEVPTLPLFIHERLSTQAILDSVKRFKSSSQLGFDFGGHPDRDLAEQLLKSYEYRTAGSTA